MAPPSPLLGFFVKNLQLFNILWVSIIVRHFFDRPKSLSREKLTRNIGVLLESLGCSHGIAKSFTDKVWHSSKIEALWMAYTAGCWHQHNSNNMSVILLLVERIRQHYVAVIFSSSSLSVLVLYATNRVCQKINQGGCQKLPTSYKIPKWPQTKRYHSRKEIILW